MYILFAVVPVPLTPDTHPGRSQSALHFLHYFLEWHLFHEPDFARAHHVIEAPFSPHLFLARAIHVIHMSPNLSVKIDTHMHFILSFYVQTTWAIGP